MLLYHMYCSIQNVQQQHTYTCVPEHVFIPILHLYLITHTWHFDLVTLNLLPKLKLNLLIYENGAGQDM